MVEIRVSPEKLRSAASQLESQRAEADSIITNMRNTVSNLQGEWTGAAQVDYVQIFNTDVPPMQTKINELLAQLIKDLNRIAQTFEDTDQNVI